MVVSDVVHAVLVDLQLIGLAHQVGKLHADFALARGADFMMVHLDHKSHFFHR